jgi:hypothetical protein
MSQRPSLEEVLRRRSQLVERAAMQRERFPEDTQGLRTAMGWFDRGAEAVAYLRAHPLALAGVAIVALVVLRRPLLGGGLVRVAKRGFVAWRGVVALRSLAQKLGR